MLAPCAGVYLSKDLMSIAGHALKANITTLGPLVLPISEQLLFFLNLVMRKVRRPQPLKCPVHNSSVFLRGHYAEMRPSHGLHVRSCMHSNGRNPGSKV